MYCKQRTYVSTQQLQDLGKYIALFHMSSLPREHAISESMSALGLLLLLHGDFMLQKLHSYPHPHSFPSFL